MNPTLCQPIRRDEEIDGFHVRLYFASRDRSVLFGCALGVLLLAIALAWNLRAPDRGEAAPAAALLSSALESGAPDAREILALLPAAAGTADETADAEFAEALERSTLAGEARQVAAAYWTSLRTFHDQPSARLLILAHRIHPAPGANESAGDLHASAGDWKAAKLYYMREAACFPGDGLRRKIIGFLSEARDFAALREFARQPEWAAGFSPRARLRLALHDGMWRAAARALTGIEVASLQPQPLALALMAGMVWLAIALQIVQPPAWISFRTVVPLFAVFAGLAASWPAHFVAEWQQEILGPAQSGDLPADLSFHLATVAPREELLKLAFALPFFPLLWRRNQPLEVLIVCGCVGLGFAIESNLQSYRLDGAASAFGRLLTANFFHLASTGLLGLAAFRALREPRRRLADFAATGILMVLAHGIHDTFIQVPGLLLLGAFSTVSFLAVSVVFFREARRWRDPATDQLYPSATFLLGLSILTATLLITASRELGFASALASLGANAAGLILAGIVFFRQLGRGLRDAAPASDIP